MIDKILNSNQEKIDGIIQVGANIGQELKILNKYSENIYLFEPLTEAFDLLAKNISKYSNIHIFKCALGEKSEIKKLIYQTPILVHHHLCWNQACIWITFLR